MHPAIPPINVNKSPDTGLQWVFSYLPVLKYIVARTCLLTQLVCPVLPLLEQLMQIQGMRCLSPVVLDLRTILRYRALGNNYSIPCSTPIVGGGREVEGTTMGLAEAAEGVTMGSVFNCVGDTVLENITGDSSVADIEGKLEVGITPRRRFDITRSQSTTKVAQQ